jgi:hypothetical protein
LLFFGVEVWASLSERSTNIHPTPADLAVLQALGIRGVPPISPTAVVVALLFPLGSLFFGFVQIRRQTVTQQDIADDEMEMERKIRMAELQARLAAADAMKNAARARGAVGVLRAGVEAVRSPLAPAPGTAGSAAHDPFPDPFDASAAPMASDPNRPGGDAVADEDLLAARPFR